MLATSKMTGLDLGGSAASMASIASKNSDTDSKRSSTSSEEMLTTPKLLPDSVSHFSATNSLRPTSLVASTTSEQSSSEAPEDMLMTPKMVTTPKTSDMWKMTFGVTSPGLRSQTAGIEAADIVQRETELPMDSDIGLRSPQDSIIARRRREFRRKQQSSHSDSNSCDTPTSENSPRDLTVSKPYTEAGSAQQPLTPTLVKRSPSPPRTPSFKEPHKPEALRLTNLTSLKDVAASDLPAHYTPSPLAVPSPNWHVVERYLTVAQTPKQLDNSVFDFLTPATPRSAKLFGGLASRDLGDKSPRLSPRITLPEAPTDLSCGRGGHSLPPEVDEAAEDLSMTSKANKVTPPPPLQCLEPPIKQEYSRPSSVVKQEYQSSRSPAESPSHPGGILMPPEAIKLEQPPPLILHDPQLPPVTSMDSSGPQDYQMRMASSAFSIIPSAANVYRQYISKPGPTVVQASVTDYRDHHNVSPASTSMYQPPANVGAWPPSWSHPDDEASVSPPHYSNPVKPVNISIKTELMASEFKKAKIEATPPKKQRAGVAAGGVGKSKAKGPKDPGNANGSKRVYSCPHCQRSYDWNYNLNRHLKYECGKENAFQCSKCGRKFPHKQNCVYHLKRKHKIVCETIDQYMTSGLVVFRGSANPGGQQIANPQNE